MSEALMKMSGVFKHVPEKYALNGLDFELLPGQVVGLLGRNGAGKTTLIECALGLKKIDAGSVSLFGESPYALSDSARARLGYVPQQNDLFEWLTAAQLLAFFKAFYPRWNDVKVDALLDRWSVPRNTVISKLSGGEKQRLSIIRAIAPDPELLILDEPVSSLDPAGRRDFLRELVDTTIERETTIIFSTHILSDLERVAMNIAFMKEGKVVMQDTLDRLAEDGYRIIGPHDALDNERFQLEITRREKAGGYLCVTARLNALEISRLHTLEPLGVRMEAVALEDLFIEVTE
jgi:ABC-2 type transport system ATP-binding protein